MRRRAPSELGFDEIVEQQPDRARDSRRQKECGDELEIRFIGFIVRRFAFFDASDADTGDIFAIKYDDADERGDVQDDVEDDAQIGIEDGVEQYEVPRTRYGQKLRHALQDG